MAALPWPAGRVTIDDSALRRRFDALRSHELTQAPPFARVLAGAPRAPRRDFAAARLAIPVSAFVVLATLWFVRPDPAPSPASGAGIGEWRAGSDVLLPTASGTPRGEMPSLSASVLDQYLSPPDQPGRTP